MLEPAIAPVKPRVRSPYTGQILLLEDFIGELLADGRQGRVAITGEPGSGKSTALCHLAAVLDADERWSGQWKLLELREDKSVLSVNPRLRIYAARTLFPGPHLATLQIVRWGRDELIEYLLAVHPQKCQSVLTRIARGERLGGLPLLWRAVLDELASCENLEDAAGALEQVTRKLLTNPELHSLAGRFSLACTLGQQVHAEQLATKLQESEPGQRALSLLCHPAVQVPLAAACVIERMRSVWVCEDLAQVMPSELIKEVGRRIVGEQRIRSKLVKVLYNRRQRRLHAMAASLLVAADPEWRPKSLRNRAFLKHARLDCVNWPEIDLEWADLFMASLQNAILSRASLANADLVSARLSWANLSSACLAGIHAPLADFSMANLAEANLENAILHEASLEEASLYRANLNAASLQRANLTGASCVEANLTGADLTSANLVNCNFTGAMLVNASLQLVDLRCCELTGACLDRANLFRADLEDVIWANARMRGANLSEALLTGSCLPNVDLRGASLVGAGLGEIDWENAELREADLNGATFHMGSSRSGLLFTPYAGEGSKTGFYTDDCNEQHFKPPEEIRKANLRGADLRGAQIMGTDFYLVDLRNALLDDRQREYVESCGAILADKD